MSSLLRRAVLVFGLGGLALVSAPGRAVDTHYEYDALGRLITVTRPDGTVTGYTLDPAGNRTKVEESLGGATAPGTINVPATSLTGSYTVSWTAGTGSVTSYQLWESTNAAFTSQTRVFVGAGTSASISGHGNGTFYYRVRGCNGSACTPYLTGTNGVVVTVPPGVPASITVPASSNNGSYSINWGAASGTLTSYQLFESQNSNFTGEVSVYSGTALVKAFTGKANGTYYYRVRACNGAACSAPRGNSSSVIVVTLPPGSPVSITVPTASNTGAYTVNWGTASGTVTAYQLYESTSSSFTSQTQVYSGTATNFGVTGKGNGTFYYRVRACNSSQCSGYRTGSNGTVVTVPPGVPASLSVPSTSNTGSYTVSWGTSTGTLTAYELYEATNASFTGEVRVYNSTGTSTALSGRANGTYYYRVRACNVTACSAPRTGSTNSIVVTIPPGSPASITVPAASNNGSFTVTWGAASGTVTAYQLYESTSASFTTETQVYSGTAMTFGVTGKGNGTYYYRVRACNSSQCSAHRTGSNGTVVTFPPGVPASLTVPSTNNTGSYTISWGTATGSPTAYELYEATNASFSGETRVYNSTGTSTTRSGRTNGTYYYRLRACNVGGCSGYAPGSNSVVVTLPPGSPPSVTVPVSTAGTSFTISWQASSGTLTAYELYESTSASFTSQTLVYNSTSTNTSLSGRTSNTYYYRVRACNSGQCSAYTTGANGILVDLIPPSAPGTPTFNIVGTSVTASYGPATDNVGVTAYEYMLNGAAGWSVAGSSSTGLSGLTHNTTYTFYVRARDGVGNAGNASSAPFTSGPPIPGVPTGLSFNQIADCAWAASWSATTHATYYLFADTQSNQSSPTGTSTTVNCPTGNPNANKPNWVKACNATGCGGQANFGAPIDVTPPTTPGTPQFSSVTSNSATVTWTASFDFSGIANYQYNIGSGWITIGSAPNVGLTGLSPSTNYTFQVRAVDNASLTGNASSAPFSTPAAPDTTPPGAPGTITMGVITSTTAPASWGAASDNVGVTGYEYRLNGAATWTNLGLVLSANIPVTGGTNYTLEVRARDGAGNTGSAASRPFSTPAPIPNQPTGLNRWNPAPEAWYATWSAVSGATSYLFSDNAGIETNLSDTNIQYQCTFGNCPNNRPKWVKACNSSGCSSKSDFAP